MRHRNGQASTAVLTAIDEIRAKILGNELRGGELVREEDFAAQLGMSRTPVREAIARLVAEGLLTKEGNRTARVFRASIPDLLEIYEIRSRLETLAAGVAAEKVDEGFRERLRQDLAALRMADMQNWPACHERFHLTIFAQSGMGRLYELIRGLRSQSEPYVRFAVHADPKLRERSQLDHEAIVAAVAAGDRRQTERLVRRHLAATQHKVKDLLHVPSAHLF